MSPGGAFVISPIINLTYKISYESACEPSPTFIRFPYLICQSFQHLFWGKVFEISFGHYKFLIENNNGGK